MDDSSGILRWKEPRRAVKAKVCRYIIADRSATKKTYRGALEACDALNDPSREGFGGYPDLEKVEELLDTRDDLRDPLTLRYLRFGGEKSLNRIIWFTELAAPATHVEATAIVQHAQHAGLIDNPRWVAGAYDDDVKEYRAQVTDFESNQTMCPHSQTKLTLDTAYYNGIWAKYLYDLDPHDSKTLSGSCVLQTKLKPEGIAGMRAWAVHKDSCTSLHSYVCQQCAVLTDEDPLLESTRAKVNESADCAPLGNRLMGPTLGRPGGFVGVQPALQCPAYRVVFEKRRGCCLGDFPVSRAKYIVNSVAECSALADANGHPMFQLSRLAFPQTTGQRLCTLLRYNDSCRSADTPAAQHCRPPTDTNALCSCHFRTKSFLQPVPTERYSSDASSC